MAQASVGWRTMTGQRLTTKTFRPDICVETETSADPAGENGIDRVEFVVTDANGSTTVTVTQRQSRRSNYSSVPPLLIRDNTGEMAPFDGYGFRLSPTAYAAGSITITATVYSRAGTATPLPWPIVLYNDSDGGDRRPCTKRIFVSPTGNDANPGTEAQPVKEPQVAAGLVRKNPAGSTLADRDAGGGEIVFMPGVHQMRNFGGVPAIHTSGDWWLTYTFLAGAILERADVAGTAPFMALGSAGAGTKQRIRWNGARLRGLPPVWFNDAAVLCDWFFDGCSKFSSHYDSSTPGPKWSVQYMEDTLTAFSAFTSTGPNARQFYANCEVTGALGGFSAYQLAQDCVVSEYIGIALETFDLGNGGSQTCNAIVQSQRALRELGGRVRGSISGCTITVPAAGQMRIQQNAAPTFPMTSLATLVDIANRDHWRVKCSGLSAGNNGDFRVLSAGSVSGLGFVVLDNPTAVAQTAGAGSLAETAAFVVNGSQVGCSFTAGTSTLTRSGGGSFVVDGFVVGSTIRVEYGTKLRRATVTSVASSTLGLYLGQSAPTWATTEPLAAVVAGYFEPDIVHSDVMFHAGTTQTNSMTSGVCTRDIDSTQSFFVPTATLIRSSFCNNRDGGYVAFAANMAGGGRTDYVFHNNTIAGVLQLPGSGQTRVSFVNNVMGSMSGLQSGGYCARNHLISGAVPGFGSGWTTGPWFAYDQFATPWWYTPLPQWIGTGASVAPHSAETWWLGAAATTPGCNRLVGLFNWSTSQDGADVTAQLSGTLPLTGSATALLEVLGQVSGTLPLTGSAIGLVGVVASLSGDLPLTGSATADVGVVGDLSGDLPLTGSATAEAGISGDLSGTLPLTGSATADLGVVGDVSGTMPLTGSGVAWLGVDGVMSGDLPLTGAAFGNIPDVGVTADLSGDLPLTGEATADVGIVGDLAGLLPLDGSGAASVETLAVGGGTLLLTGSATATVAAMPAAIAAPRRLREPPPKPWRRPREARPARTYRP